MGVVGSVVAAIVLDIPKAAKRLLLLLGKKLERLRFRLEPSDEGYDKVDLKAYVARVEFAEVEAAFRDTNKSVIVIWGIGGAGKSTFAGYCLSHMAEQGYQTIHSPFICKNGATTLDGLIITLTNHPTFGVHFSPLLQDSRPAQEKISSIVTALEETGRYVLLFDDYHEADNPELDNFILRVNQHGKNTKLLLTSRVKLELFNRAGFAMVHLQNLPLDRAKELLCLYNPRLHGESDATLERIWIKCHHGVPYALVIFAEMSKQESIASLLTTLPDFFERDEDWQRRLFDQLTDGEKNLTLLLSLIRKPLTSDSLSHLHKIYPKRKWSKVRDDLNNLMSRAIIYPLQDNTFVMHDLFRHFCVNQLKDGSLAQRRYRVLNRRVAQFYLLIPNSNETNWVIWQVEAWEHYFKAGEAEMGKQLDVRIRNISSLSPNEEGVNAVKSLIYGYRIFVEHTGRSYPRVAEAVASAAPQLFSVEGHGRSLFFKIADSPRWLVGLIDSGLFGEEDNDNLSALFHNDLYLLCRAFSSYVEAATISEREHLRFWFNHFARVRNFCRERGIQHLKAEEIKDWLRQIGPLVAPNITELGKLERNAYYEEQDGEFLLAARHSEHAANLATNTGLHNFAAGLRACAGRCYEQDGNLDKAVEMFAQAADFMTDNGKVSIRALQHYESANRLTLDHGNYTEKKTSLLAMIEQVRQSARATVVIVANTFDIDFADLLVGVLSPNIYCTFESPNKIKNLGQLALSYDAVIIVGGIGAHQTSSHLRQYFHDLPSLKNGLVFKRLLPIDSEPSIKSYCDFWRSEIDGRPVYVLAGARRSETCQAVVDFISHQEFQNLVHDTLQNR